MTGKEMRILIGSGTCPNCGGALSNRTRIGDEFTTGGCDPCNINWAGIVPEGKEGSVQGAPKWAKK